MVAGSQTQGVLSQNGSTVNGDSQRGSTKPETVTVVAPSHVTDYYSANTLGCSGGVR